MDANVQTSQFVPKCGSGLREYHSIIRAPRAAYGSAPAGGFETRQYEFEAQLQAVLAALIGISEVQDVRFVRFYLSDAANQQAVLEQAIGALPAALSGVPVSIIGQPPLDGTKIAAWVYSTEGEVRDCELIWDARMRGGAAKPAGNSEDSGVFGAAGVCADGTPRGAEGDSEAQMSGIFGRYSEVLGERGLSVARDCIRTWIYVHDVDVNYPGVVRGRRQFFNTIGLTPQTHFIASTGIEERSCDPHCTVVMDALAVRGLRPEQLRYLHAYDHLSPTADYGVTFERGTAVQFSDRIHIYISGTASIDSKGQVLYPGDVRKQTFRMLENIAALLAEAGAGPEDAAVATVYLRDMADYLTVKEIIESELPRLNAVYVLAPVCRPAWLVEMECIAII